MAKSPTQLGATAAYEPFRCPPGLKGLPDTVGVYDAHLGSTRSAFLSGRWLNLPGTVGNNASTPNAAALQITGDIDIRVRVAMDDWTPTGFQTLVDKWISLTGGYGFYVNSSGTGQLYANWVDGATNRTATSTAAVPFTDGQVGWVRFTLDVNNGGGGYTVRFYTSSDGVTWTQLGADVVVAVVTSITTGTQLLQVGERVGGALPAAGRFYRAQVLNGIDGTVVFDADFAAAQVGATSFRESSSNAAVVTINSSAADINDPTYPLVGPNLLAGSEEFDQTAYWATGAASITVDAADAPSSVATASSGRAEKLIENTATAVHSVSSQTTSQAVQYTFSVHLKAGERTRVKVAIFDGVADRAASIFNLSTGVVVSTSAGSAAIADAGGGWYRCSVTGTVVNARTGGLGFVILDNGATQSYLGDGVSGLLVWGAQLEQASAPSAYSRSNANALSFVTDDYAQIADAAALNFGSAMTAFVVFKAAAVGTRVLLGQYDTTANQRSWLIQESTGKARALLSNTGAAAQKEYVSSVTTFDNTPHSFAFTYDGTTLKLYNDGREDAAPVKTLDAACVSLFNSTASLTLAASLASGVAANFLTGEKHAVVLLPTALSAGDIAHLHEHYRTQLAADGVSLPPGPPTGGPRHRTNPGEIRTAYALRN